MPATAKNPENPYTAAVDALSTLNLLVILEYIEHRGGPSKLASLSIGKIPGMLSVIHYIDHEQGINNRPTDVFDFFRFDRKNLQTETGDDTQALVFILDESEDHCGADTDELPVCLLEESAAVVVGSQAQDNIHSQCDWQG
jgi:hypothetical protein